MKTIIASINPQWVHAIFSPVRKKRWEIRKKSPKEVPFKCLIYMTKGGGEWRDPWTTAICNPPHEMYNGAGKVVGEFICDQVFHIQPFLLSAEDPFVHETCVPLQDIRQYLGEKGGYGWHISQLKIYDKPREIGEFKKPSQCPENIDCCACKYWNSDAKDCGEDLRLIRPPQSWCYVEGER